MEERRLARYLAKVDHATARLRLVDEWSSGAAKSVQVELATYHAFQEAAEAAADLAAMIVVDSGQPSKDDRANLASASAAGAFPAHLVASLQEATSLRNRLVHEYDGLDKSTALISIQRLAPAIRAFLTEVARWLTKRS